MSFYDELKRRNVFRVGVAYIVASWVFLQVADLVLEAINAPDWVLQALMMLVALGFIAALIIAWAYEMTPEGLKREQDADPNRVASTYTADKLNRITIGLVIAAVLIVAVDRLVPEEEMGSEPFSQQTTVQDQSLSDEKRALTPPDGDSTTAEKSVAVLPFVNMSSDPEQEFFSDGISEEILNVLTRIPNLKVAARTSSFQFKGQNLDIADIARQLKVNHILEGSVRKSGLQLRITAQLIEAETGYHLWSDTYDRKLEDVFAIQDEIAGAIAEELRTRLSDSEEEHTTSINIEAYELYLKGRALVATRREAELYEGIDLLKAALDIEPAYAPAMAHIALANMVLPWFSIREPAGVLRERAREWAARALAIEPNNPEALASMAIVLNEVDFNFDSALELLQRAVTANPGNVTANNFLGDIATRVADLETAMIYESRALELDPLGTVQLTDLANVYALRGDWPKVLELAQRALEIDPAFLSAYRHVLDATWALGDLDEFDKAEAATASVMGDPGTNRIWVESSVAHGDLEAAKEELELISELARNGKYAAVRVANAAVALEDFDTAGKMLLQAYAEKDGTWIFPLRIRLPEQAPDSQPWQEFWSKPGPARLAELRRKNGFYPHAPTFGGAAGEAP